MVLQLFEQHAELVRQKAPDAPQVDTTHVIVLPEPW